MPPRHKHRHDHEPNLYVKGSVYRVRSLGTHEAPVETEGEFLGFTQFGMAGEALRLRLGKAHGKDAGKVRVVPLHMVLHFDVLELKEDEHEVEEEGHPVSYS